MLTEKLRTLVPAALAGLCAFGLTLQMESFSRQRIGLGILAVLLVSVALLSRQPKAVLLFAGVVSFSHYRRYELPPIAGVEGLYWLPADLCLLALWGLWAYEVIVLKRPLAPHGPALWRWGGLWAFVLIVSAAQADETWRSAGELLRLWKVLLILLFCRYNLGRREWWACAAALGLSACLQGALGVIQVATGKLLPPQEEGAWIRAFGTMPHPNVLASFLLLVSPMLLALLVGARRPVLRAACALGALPAFLGLGLTLSRWPWALALMQAGLVMAAFTALGVLRLKHVIGAISVGTVVLVILLLPFRQRIIDRFTGDLRASIEFRSELGEIALQMVSQRPFFGVGLNSFTNHLVRLAPQYGPEAEQAEQRVQKGTRVPMVVHNLYLLLLAETGILGLGAFVLFLLKALGSGVRAIRSSGGAVRNASLGLLIGMVGVLGHMMTDFTLWFEPVLFSFALVAGMLNNVSALADSPADNAAGRRRFHAEVLAT